MPAIFWLTALVATSLVAYEAPGLILAIVILLAWMHILSRQTEGQAILRLVGWVFLFLLFNPIWQPGMPTAREIARQTQCSHNVKSICLALLNYESVNGHFPPPYIADADGKPIGG